MATILYARVSTLEQTIEHQAAHARAAGFVIDKILQDEGVSGVTLKLADRPQGKRLYDLLRGGDTLVVRWIDRLGRNYSDVCEAIRHFMDRGVIIRTVINNMTFDGSTKEPMQMAVRDALIAFMAATAQAQAEATKEAQAAGIAFAKSAEKYKGRKPSYSRTEYALVQDLLATGSGASAIAAETGLTRQTVLRIRDRPEQAAAALAAWGM
ncbi:recombinase family protein [Terrihabitans sp. B22-R8]|uniref:recombinase family protein n=1 Tax=Terrihabitans sp. B22-R8 TaxID=3425128 RepID=UPI00403D2F5B